MNKRIAAGCYFVLPFLVLSLTMFAWLSGELKSLFASSHGYQLSINAILAERARSSKNRDRVLFSAVGKNMRLFLQIKEGISMDTLTFLLIFSGTLTVFTSIILLFYLVWIRPKDSLLRQTPQKNNFSPQIASDPRILNTPQVASDPRILNTPQVASDSGALNSREGWQQSRKHFDSPSLSSQMQLEHVNANNSIPGSSPSPYNSRYTDEPPQIITSGSRSVEHYEQCIHVLYEPRIDGISLVFTNAVITNATEVDNVFTVCERKFKEVMRSRGWKHVGWIADLGGYNLVGTEATTLVGEALKLFLDKFGLKTKGGLYLIAHYSSKAAPPDQETLNEKLKRIQFITAGVINEFQGNVFDTREEAIAFYLRLKQELLAGR